MSTNPFKAFIPFIITGTAIRNPPIDGEAENHVSRDPDSAQWRTVGLVPPLPGDPALYADLQGTGTLMAVQFNERILPGKVRDEQVAKKVAKIERLEGRKIGKKEYASIRDEVEFELLPKAFIRRSVVQVFFRKNVMMVCTSSEKRAVDAVACLSALFGLPELYAYRMEAKSAVAPILTLMAKEPDFEAMNWFQLGTSAVLKGGDKQTVRIKDISIEAGKVQSLIEDGDYRVVELGLDYWKDGAPSDPEENDADLSFVVNEHLAFKRIDLVNIKPTGESAADLFTLALICCKTFYALLDEVVEACGGAAPRPPLASDDDGEL